MNKVLIKVGIINVSNEDYEKSKYKVISQWIRAQYFNTKFPSPVQFNPSVTIIVFLKAKPKSIKMPSHSFLTLVFHNSNQSCDDILHMFLVTRVS